MAHKAVLSETFLRDFEVLGEWMEKSQAAERLEKSESVENHHPLSCSKKH